MPGIAFTYEMDGQTQVQVFGDSYAIPGPDNPTDKCPFCGPSLPDNATRYHFRLIFECFLTVFRVIGSIMMNRIMRKGYYLAVSWIDFLAGQIIGELVRLLLQWKRNAIFIIFNNILFNKFIIFDKILCNTFIIFDKILFCASISFY